MKEIKIKDSRLNGDILLHGMTVITGADEKAISIIMNIVQSISLKRYATKSILTADDPSGVRPMHRVFAFAQDLCRAAADHNNVYIVTTAYTPQFLRAIEIYADEYHVMTDKLDVYRVSMDENDKISFENVMYSEYGMTSIYEEMRKPLDDLEHEFELKQWSLMS